MYGFRMDSMGCNGLSCMSTGKEEENIIVLNTKCWQSPNDASPIKKIKKVVLLVTTLGKTTLL